MRPLAPVVKVIPPPIRKHLPWLLVVAIVGTAAVGFGSSGFSTIFQSNAPTSLGAGPCGLAQAAFCDPLNASAPNGNRAGDLNGTVWGASRFGGNVSSQGLADEWEATSLDLCGTLLPSVLPPNDIRVCGGQLVEGADDHGGTLGLAAYPKQPFDFAGRVGTLRFDLGDDSAGTHAAWPEVVITDQPVPVPHPNVVDPTTWNLPRNAIGISFAAGGNSLPGPNFPPGGPNVNCVTADEAWTVSNHQLTTYGVYANTGFSIRGCVLKGTVGHLNHFAVQFSSVSPNIQVWATDPDSSTYRLIAEGDNLSLPLTRGLTWLEDDHYNGCKDQAFGPACQGQHTFAWANWGFDGPVLARDLTFDVPDNTRSLGTGPVSGQPALDLGYMTVGSQLTLQIPGVTNLAQASGALLTFNAEPQNAETLSYALNGHAPQTFGLAPQTVSGTYAVPLNLADLVEGTNTVTFAGSDSAQTAFANVDLILQGAGGGGSASTPVPTDSATATPTAVSTSTPPPTAVAVSTATPAPVTTPATGAMSCALSVAPDGSVSGACVRS